MLIFQEFMDRLCLTKCLSTLILYYQNFIIDLDFIGFTISLWLYCSKSHTDNGRKMEIGW